MLVQAIWDETEGMSEIIPIRASFDDWGELGTLELDQSSQSLQFFPERRREYFGHSLERSITSRIREIFGDTASIQDCQGLLLPISVAEAAPLSTIPTMLQIRENPARRSRCRVGSGDGIEGCQIMPSQDSRKILPVCQTKTPFCHRRCRRSLSRSHM
jgi:hypothetical protein